MAWSAFNGRSTRSLQNRLRGAVEQLERESLESVRADEHEPHQGVAGRLRDR
jgi:hypothetical protein